MEIKEFSLEEACPLLTTFVGKEHIIAYNSLGFNRLNQHKANKVSAFVLYDHDSPVAFQILGLKDDEWRAPFSAPFSSLTLLNHTIEPPVATFYNLLSAHLQKDIRLVWPAPFYDAPRAPQATDPIYDFNYHYPLSQCGNYESFLSRAGRYNHHRALKHPFEFSRTDDIPRAYAIIEENRRAMGYPLALSLSAVLDTVKIIPADFFIMSLSGKDVAAAMLYQVTTTIMQVIYWGDIPEARHARAMNHLAWQVFRWYALNRPDIEVIDIGPASSDGIRNEGLIQFKLSLGCIETLKPTLLINKH